MFTPFNVNDILLEMGRFNCRLWKAWDLMQVCEASPGEGPEYWKTWKRWFCVFCVWWCFMKFCAKTPIVSIFDYDVIISLFSPAYLKPERLMEPEPGSPHRCFSIQFGIPSMEGAEKPSTPVRLGKGCPMDRPSDVLTSSCGFARMFAYLSSVCLHHWKRLVFEESLPTFDSPSNGSRKWMCSEWSRVSGTFSFNGW